VQQQTLDLGRRDHARKAGRESFDCASIDQRLELGATHAEPSCCLTDRQHADAPTFDRPPDLDNAAITSSTELIASRTAGRLANGYPPNVLRTDQEGTITLPM
jgi:hypothetical protein